MQREERTSDSPVSNHPPVVTLDLRHARTLSPEHGHAVTNPRISD